MMVNWTADLEDKYNGGMSFGYVEREQLFLERTRDDYNV